MFKKLSSLLFIAALFSCGHTSVYAATSTVNPNVPAANSSLSSSVIRGNFAAAYSDINTIYNTAIFSASPVFTGAVSGTSAVWSGSDTAAYFKPVGATAPPNGLYLPNTNTPGIAANGAPVAQFLPTSGGTDWFTFQGAASATPAYINLNAAGTDTNLGINYNSLGTTTTGSQYNGLCNGLACISGKHFFNINGWPALEITDTLWNPNVSYQGHPTAWPVLSSGALAGGPDNIAVISVNSSIYPGTATGATLMYITKGLTGAHHFTTNGVVGHVNIGGITNPNGNDVYNTAESALWFYGAATGTGGGAVINTQGGTSNGTLFYDAGSGGYRFKTDNTATNLFGMARSVSGGDGAFLTAQAAGSGPLFATMSSGTNAPFTLASKGNSNLNLATNNGTIQAIIPHTASAVNAVSLTGGATGNKPSITIGGTSADANVGLTIKTKGTSATGLDFYDGTARQFSVFGGNTSVGYLTASGAPSGSAPSLSSQNAGGGGLTLYTSDTGNITFATNNTAELLTVMKRVASSVNYLQVSPGATGTAIKLESVGSDTNINVNVLPKGNGGLTTPGVLSTGTKFTTSGCSVSATTGGASAGKITSGTTGTCTVVITMGGATGLVAPNGWHCDAKDQTSGVQLNQTADSTTTCTISGTTTTGDIINFAATGF